jgi:hypothetical protein
VRDEGDSRSQQRLSGSLVLQRKEGDSKLAEKFATVSAANLLDCVDITTSSMISPVRGYEMSDTKVTPLCPRKKCLEGQGGGHFHWGLFVETYSPQDAQH